MRPTSPLHQKTLIRNGVIVTMNRSRDVLVGDLLVENGRISRIGKRLSKPSGRVNLIDARGGFVIPGLIQTHTHLCQALFRGYADDLALLDWLKEKIWPMENAHTAKSLRASAQIGLLEMQLSGTTSILDMGTVRHTDTLLEVARESGIRYWGGKCLMDRKDSAGPLYEKTDASLREIERHLAALSRDQNDASLMHYALCPRFAVSCTDGLMEAMTDYQKRFDVVIHTHASESKEEIALVRKRTGFNNVDYFDHLGILNPRTVIVHGVHLTRGELKKMVRKKTPLVHCPSSNLKLGSGVAPIEMYRQSGLTVSLGSDGAPCNNSMDPFIEMRLAALIQKPLYGPEALPAQAALEMATLEGARTLGMEHEIGSLEVGKRADITVIDRSHPSVNTVENPYSSIVYSCLGRDVTDVLIEGRTIVRSREHQIYDRDRVLAEARLELRKLLRRMV